MNRILLPDIVRSLCVFWIVAVWHIFDYIEPVSWKMNLYPITNGVLAAFTFLSGLFLGKKDMDFTKFYSNRLIRFMPLLCFALVLFKLVHLIGLKTLLLTMTGLSCFIPPQPPTLWFFSMMIVFYIFTPLLMFKIRIYEKKDRLVFVQRALFLYILLCIVNCLLPVDNRLLVYYPFYVIGIIFPLNKLETFHKEALMLIPVSIIFLLMGYMLTNRGGYLQILCETLSGLGIMVLVFIMCSFVEKPIIGARLKPVIEFCSYISMSAYLFHRVVYNIVRSIMSSEYLNLIHILIMVLIMVGVAYLVQHTYDMFIRKFVFRHGK